MISFRSAFIIAVVGVLLSTGIIEFKVDRHAIRENQIKLKKLTSKMLLAAGFTTSSSLDNNNNNNDADDDDASFFFSSSSSSSSSGASKDNAPNLLKEHNKIYDKKEIVTIYEDKKDPRKVYLAIGFGLANVVVMDDGTENGLVLIDAMESEEPMQEILNTFQAKGILRNRKINTLIYTHWHADHAQGSRVVNASRIVSHELTVDLLLSSPSVGPALYRRSMRQFGVHLPKKEHAGCGIGPFLRVKDETTSLTLPTETFSGKTHNITVGKHWKLHLYHAPGETPDHIHVVVDDLPNGERLVVAGDNIYQAFPNLYAIRGSQSRDALLWAEAVDSVRRLRPDYLALMHTPHVVGKAKIHSILTHYRDAITFVHDQSVFWLNRDKTPDEIVQLVQLPKHLRNHPWLIPYYGSVPWSSRAVVAHHVGWFGSGHPKDLNPSVPGSLARSIVAASASSASSTTSSSGSASSLLARADLHLQASTTSTKKKNEKTESSTKDNNKNLLPIDETSPRENAQLALELSSLVLDASSTTFASSTTTTTSVTITPEEIEKAKQIRREAILKLASLSVPATGRNYLLTWLAEREGELEMRIPPSMARNTLENVKDSYVLLRAMAVNLDAKLSEDTNWLCKFTFTDSKEVFFFQIRRGVSDIYKQDAASALQIEALSVDDAEKKNQKKETKKDTDLELETTRKSWSEVMTRKRSPALMLASGEIKIVKGGLTQMSTFRSLFNSPV